LRVNLTFSGFLLSSQGISLSLLLLLGYLCFLSSKSVCLFSLLFFLIGGDLLIDK
jgi:hypothetical protein